MQSAVSRIVILPALQDSCILVQNVGNQRSSVQFKREKIKVFGGIFSNSRVSLPISEKKRIQTGPKSKHSLT
jgi:hypothetical protein